MQFWSKSERLIATGLCEMVWNDPIEKLIYQRYAGRKSLGLGSWKFETPWKISFHPKFLLPLRKSKHMQ